MNDRDLIFEQYKLIKEEGRTPNMVPNPGAPGYLGLTIDKRRLEDRPTEKEGEEPTMTIDRNGIREWTLSNGKTHRLDGPAVIYPNGDKEWWVNDKQHRVDGPAIEYVDGHKEWYINGQHHREDGPAIEFPDGYKEWYLNDKRHRIGGPAVESISGRKEWWVNGQRHREDGPAFEGADGTKEWWANDRRLTPGEWAKAVLKLHNKPHDQKDIDELLRGILSKSAEDLL